MHNNVEQIGFPYDSMNRIVEEDEEKETQLHGDGITSRILLFDSVRIKDYNPRHWR